MADEEEVLLERVSALIRDSGGSKMLAEKTGIPLGTLNKYLAKTSMASFCECRASRRGNGPDLQMIALGGSKFGTEIRPPQASLPNATS